MQISGILFCERIVFREANVVEPVPKEEAQRDADLRPDHIVHSRKGRNQQNFANRIFGRELESGSPSERVAKDAKSRAVTFPCFFLPQSSKRALGVLEDRLRIWSSLTYPVAWIVDQQITAAWIRRSTDQGYPG